MSNQKISLTTTSAAKVRAVSEWDRLPACHGLKRQAGSLSHGFALHDPLTRATRAMSAFRPSMKFFAIIAVIAVTVGQSGCQTHSESVVAGAVDTQQHGFTGRTMGTSYSIKYLTWPGMPPTDEVRDVVAAELARVNAQMSTYDPDSELSRFNAERSTDWFSVSAETVAVLQTAREIHLATDGKFDVTVGPLVDLWGFGPPGRREELPSQDAVRDTLTYVGIDKLEIRMEPPALRKRMPDLRVDLSAIAKGHGVDRVAGRLEALQCKDYFVEIGGEVRTLGQRGDGGAWQVGIEKPDEGARSVQIAVPLSGQSLATSGDYRNFYLQSERKIVHLIDPQSGQPTSSDLALVSVVSHDCTHADALATGLIASGLEAAWRLAKQRGWAVMFIARRDGGFEVSTTPEFDALFQSVESNGQD